MKRMFNSNKVWYDIHQSLQLYQNCIMLAQFAVRRLRDRMHRGDRLLQTENFIGKERLFLVRIKFDGCEFFILTKF